MIFKPHSESIRVAFNRIRRCPNEIPDISESDGTAEPETTGGGATLDTEVEATSTAKPRSRAPPQLEKMILNRALDEKFLVPGGTALDPGRASQARTLALRMGKCSILPILGLDSVKYVTMYSMDTGP